MGFRTFVPLVAACPGCGRTTSTTFPGTGAQHPGFHPRRNAQLEDALSRRRGAQRRDHGLHRQRSRRIQACRYRHILAGTGETRRRRCFVDGKKFRTLRGPNIATEFKAMVIDYIDQRYGAGAKPTAAE